MIFNHHRFQIWNSQQHPYKHRLNEFPFFNPALPPGTVYNAEQAMNWIFAVLYPNTKDAVNTVGDLPLVGNSLNDYRVVLDDGDGKAASYRWEQREGDITPKWYKIYDMDWGEQSILSNFLTKTQDVYVFRYGHDDVDDDGNPLAGDLAGQFIYGGASAGTHLTLYANAGDGVGPNSGYIQFGDDVRPLLDGQYTLGTAGYRFADLHAAMGTIADFDITNGSIVSATATIDFGVNNLDTDGFIRSGSTSVSDGSITDTTGIIDFDDEDLTTTGIISADSVNALGSPSSFFSGTTVGDITLSDGSIVSVTGTIDFDDEHLTTTGNITGAVGTFTDIIGTDIQIINDTILTVAASGTDINLSPDGNLNITRPSFFTDSVDVTADVTINNNPLTIIGSYLEIDDILINGASNVITTVAGNLILASFANIEIQAHIVPDSTGVYDLGAVGFTLNDIYFSGDLTDGVTAITSATIQSLRDINSSVNPGDTIFWNGTKWVSSAPDTEVDHGTISGLLDDDHTQYALLAGRSGGQSLFGGLDANDNLYLYSTAHATLGSIVAGSDIISDTDGGFNLGGPSNRFDDLYMTGEGIGFRVQNFANFAGFDAASGLTIGRLAYDAAAEDLYMDIGGTWKRVSPDTYYFEDSVNWDGVATSYTYTVTGVTDARRMVWQFKDNANNFDVLLAKITSPSATQITVSFDTPPPASTYTLVGVGL